MADTKDKEHDPLSRWSRLKSESQRAVPAEPEANPTQDDAVAAADAETDAQAIADLPDIESLTYESDFTVFLREAVPEELRRLALRKLWRSSPVLANLDGLNDYDLDYRSLGADPRVAEALLAQREGRERALRARSRPDDAPRPQRTPDPAAQAKPREEPEAPEETATPGESEAENQA